MSNSTAATLSDPLLLPPGGHLGGGGDGSSRELLMTLAPLPAVATASTTADMGNLNHEKEDHLAAEGRKREEDHLPAEGRKRASTIHWKVPTEYGGSGLS